MRIAFGLVAAALILAGAPLARAATKIDDPEKFVRNVYEHIAKTKDYQEPTDIYSPHLKQAFDLDSKEAGGEVGRIDFDFWINAQDSELKDIRVSSQPVENTTSRRTVIAKFKNISTPEEIHFYFEKTGNGWQLDDARSLGKEAWTLSLIAKYGWEDAK